MWAWGKREQGECGSGSEPPPEEAKKPLLEPTPTDCTSLLGPIVAVAAGEGHSLVLDSLGNVYVWGRTREGQAARVSQVPQHAPLLVQQLSHEIVTAVACGASSCFAVAASGRCYTWGSVLERSGGQLHHDAAGYGRSFSELSEATQRMLKLSVSDYINCSEASSRRNGPLAEQSHPHPHPHPQQEQQQQEEQEQQQQEPEFLANQDYRRVAQAEVAPLYLGLGRSHARVSGVAGGFSFCVLLLEGGGAMAHGFNDRFQLGLGDRRMRGEPTFIPALEGVQLIAVACGQQHTCAIDAQGRCYSWGLGSFGQLGHGSFSDEPRPRKVAAALEGLSVHLSPRGA
jgi:E3 ubiquitin-protein ligase HERC4